MSENQQAIKAKVFLFNAREMGRTLREVAFDVIQSENGDIECRWFRNQSECDLFYWKDQKHNIIKQQVNFYGQVVEWNIIEGLRTGMVIEEEMTEDSSGQIDEHQKSAHQGSAQDKKPKNIVRFDKAPLAHAIEQGVEIVGHITTLNANDKYQIISNFNKSPLFNELKPDEVVRKFGQYIKHNNSIAFRIVKVIKKILGFS